MMFGVMAMSPGLVCVLGVGDGVPVGVLVMVGVGVVPTVAVLVGCVLLVTVKVVVALRGLNASVARIVCVPTAQFCPTTNVTENVPSLPTIIVVCALASPVCTVCSVVFTCCMSTSAPAICGVSCAG